LGFSRERQSELGHSPIDDLREKQVRFLYLATRRAVREHLATGARVEPGGRRLPLTCAGWKRID